MQHTGIHLDGDEVLLSTSHGKGRSRTFSLTKALQGEGVKLLYKQTTSGIPSSALLCRPFAKSGTSRRFLEEIISFEKEQGPLAKEPSIAVPLWEKRIFPLLFTAKKETLKNTLSTLEKVGIDPDHLTAEGEALVAFGRHRYPNYPHFVLIHVGTKETTVVLMEKGELKKTFSILVGKEHWLQAYWQDARKKVRFSEVAPLAKRSDLLLLPKENFPHLQEALDDLFLRLSKRFSTENLQEVPWTITGRIDTFLHAASYAEKILSSFLGPFVPPPPLEESGHAIAIGLSLLAPPSVEFRREEFFPKKALRKTFFWAVGLAAISCLGALLLVYLGTKELSQEKELLTTRLSTFLAKTDPALRETLFANGEKNALTTWQTLGQKPASRPFYLQPPPKVSSVLSWFAKHPLLEEFRKNNDPFPLEDLQYRLTSYPHIENPGAPYKAHVTLSFRTPYPLHARKFHEALLAKDPRIDPSIPITWESKDDLYTLSFSLKPGDTR